MSQYPRDLGGGMRAQAERLRHIAAPAGSERPRQGRNFCVCVVFLLEESRHEALCCQIATMICFEASSKLRLLFLVVGRGRKTDGGTRFCYHAKSKGWRRISVISYVFSTVLSPLFNVNNSPTDIDLFLCVSKEFNSSDATDVHTSVAPSVIKTRGPSVSRIRIQKMFAH